MSNEQANALLSIKQLLRRRAFQAGHRDKLKGEWNCDDFAEPRDQWQYERGRQFAVLWPKRFIFGRFTCKYAELQLRLANIDKEII